MMSRTRSRIGIGLLIAGTLLVGCAPSRAATSDGLQSQAPIGPKRATLAVRGDGSGLWAAGGGDETFELYYGGMVMYDPTGEIVPQLAEAVPTLESGLWKLFSDGRMETTHTIRQGARWHDGTPMTTKDLEFGFAWGRAPENISNIGAGAYAPIERLEARDDRTMVVSWKSPSILANALFMGSGEFFAPPIAAHILEPIYRQDPSQMMNSRYFTSEFVGNGPFRVEEFVGGSHTRLKAYDGYILGRPRIDEIEIRYFNDANTIGANVLAGTVDLTLGPGLSVGQAVAVQQGWANGKMIYSTYYDRTLNLFPQFLNPDPAILLNVDMRRALAHAIDREEIVASVQLGVGEVKDAWVLPRGPNYEGVRHAIVRYPFDPRRSAQLIEGLGYTKGADGLYRDSAGQELKSPVWGNTNTDSNRRTTLAVADYWKRVGVAADPYFTPAGVDRSVVPSRPGFLVSTLKTEIDRRFTGPEARVAENRYTGSSNSRYMNPEYDALVDKYFLSVPRQDRLRAWADIIQHMTSNLVAIHLIYEPVPQLINNRLRDVEPRTARAQAFNSQLWDVD